MVHRPIFILTADRWNETEQGTVNVSCLSVAFHIFIAHTDKTSDSTNAYVRSCGCDESTATWGFAVLTRSLILFHSSLFTLTDLFNSLCIAITKLCFLIVSLHQLQLDCLRAAKLERYYSTRLRIAFHYVSSWLKFEICKQNLLRGIFHKKFHTDFRSGHTNLALLCPMQRVFISQSRVGYSCYICRLHRWVLQIFLSFPFHFDRLCGLVVRVLGYRSRGLGSIPGTTRFSEK
jgi:hypothetical protein